MEMVPIQGPEGSPFANTSFKEAGLIGSWSH